MESARLGVECGCVHLKGESLKLKEIPMTRYRKALYVLGVIQVYRGCTIPTVLLGLCYVKMAS